MGEGGRLTGGLPKSGGIIGTGSWKNEPDSVGRTSEELKDGTGEGGRITGGLPSSGGISGTGGWKNEAGSVGGVRRLCLGLGRMIV
jgi:hypothetical protein